MEYKETYVKFFLQRNHIMIFENSPEIEKDITRCRFKIYIVRNAQLNQLNHALQIKWILKKVIEENITKQIL